MLKYALMHHRSLRHYSSELASGESRENEENERGEKEEKDFILKDRKVRENEVKIKCNTVPVFSVKVSTPSTPSVRLRQNAMPFKVP
jgi:hypothetical protein